MDLVKKFEKKMLQVLNAKGYDILRYPHTSTSGKKLVNVGSGGWQCPGWINLDYSTDWYAGEHSAVEYIEYDMRKNDLPFSSASVDCIYCSHVIEHIEDRFIAHFFAEVYRILEVGGVFRITCPDAEHMYNMTKTGKAWWQWLKYNISVEWEQLSAVDCLVQEIASPRMRLNIRNSGLPVFAYENEFNEMKMIEFFDYITNGLEFDPVHVGSHINYWTIGKLQSFLRKAGFETIINSRCQSSISPYMQSKVYFDKTWPVMSLYIDAIK